jgi:hypothetical protein
VTLYARDDHEASHSGVASAARTHPKIGAASRCHRHAHCARAPGAHNARSASHMRPRTGSSVAYARSRAARSVRAFTVRSSPSALRMTATASRTPRPSTSSVSRSSTTTKASGRVFRAPETNTRTRSPNPEVFPSIDCRVPHARTYCPLGDGCASAGGSSVRPGCACGKMEP